MHGGIPPPQTAQRLIKYSDDFTLGYCRRPAASDRGQGKMSRYLVRGSRGVSDLSTVVLTWKDGINLKNRKYQHRPIFWFSYNKASRLIIFKILEILHS